MVNTIVVWLISILFTGLLNASDGIFLSQYLGEKKLDGYFERFSPIVSHDVYLGSLGFQDDIYFQQYFSYLISPDELELSKFFKSEYKSGVICPEETLVRHEADIRFSYRLITLSYLLEAQTHMKAMGEKLKFNKVCDFNLKNWLKECKPNTLNMKNFLQRLGKYHPAFEDQLSRTYSFENWQKDLQEEVPKYYSHHKIKPLCKGGCGKDDLAPKFQLVCQTNLRLMNAICSEVDEIYGLSQFRDAYSLIAQSNIINTFNKNGEALGCLRKFSEIHSFKEVKYPALYFLFPSVQEFLRAHFKERFLQGRGFIYGSSKEFEEKGLDRLFVDSKKFEVDLIKEESDLPKEVAKIEAPKNEKSIEEKVVVAQVPNSNEYREIKEVLKSAFLQAAELRRIQNAQEIEVDMLKLKYDYVFTLNMLNKLLKRLKVFMSREALQEMVSFDKLGSIDAPVPLLFLKYMIDMQEHQGLWNIISVLGDSFYVSNEIDASFNPKPELIRLQNNPGVVGNWQLYIKAN